MYVCSAFYCPVLFVVVIFLNNSKMGRIVLCVCSYIRLSETPSKIYNNVLIPKNTKKPRLIWELVTTKIN